MPCRRLISGFLAAGHWARNLPKTQDPAGDEGGATPLLGNHLIVAHAPPGVFPRFILQKNVIEVVVDKLQVRSLSLNDVLTIDGNIGNRQREGD